ncbi:hypothetical protein [Kitasatospora sp. NPDC088783]|uniref:hypothetical protein n=1 Tax=Kitasatospora sp. NPDC088783 TaxID=3364077 RepID=UPI00382AB970
MPVAPVKSHYEKPKPMGAWQPTRTSWPSGTADATVGATAATAGQAGSLPVRLSAAQHLPTAATPAKVHVTVAPHDTATAAGVSGVLLSVQRADGTDAPGAAHLSLSYQQFQDAFGGDWGSRSGSRPRSTCRPPPHRPRCT